MGSLEAGKDADFIVLSGDPLSVYTKVEQTWVEGRKVFDLAEPADWLATTAASARAAPSTSTSTSTRRTGNEPQDIVRSGLAAVACSCPSCMPALAQAQLAVRGATVHTMAGAPIKTALCSSATAKLNGRAGLAGGVPAGYRELRAQVVTPGLIDAHTVVGLAATSTSRTTRTRSRRSSPIQPELRAVDAYNPRERLVEWVREHGVTTVHTGHGPGVLVSGQTMVVKTRAEGRQRPSVLVPEAMVAVTLGSARVARAGVHRAPGPRPVAMLRAELIKAREYAGKLTGPEDRRPPRDLRLDTLARVVRGEMPLLVTAHRAHDLLAALRAGQGVRIRVVLDGAAEAQLIADRRSRPPASPSSSIRRWRAGRRDAENLTLENAALLRKAGVPIALQSGFESYVPKTRVVLFEAALTAAHGLSVRRGAGGHHDRRGPAARASTVASARSRPARTPTWRSTMAIRSSTRPTCRPW